MAMIARLGYVCLLVCVATAPTSQPGESRTPQGKWKILSLGERQIPRDKTLIWEFVPGGSVSGAASGTVTTSINGQQATVATYTLRDGPKSLKASHVIELTYAGEKSPSRAGLVEVEGGRMRICLSSGAAPPSEWVAALTVVFESVK